MVKTEEFSDILSGDVFDIRDVVARFEDLETDLDGYEDKSGCEYDDAAEEFAKIQSFLAEVRGEGGDYQWRGDWYPATFIDNGYFQDYAEELVKGIGDLPQDIPHYIVIDWEATANNIRMDYSSVEIDGRVWWYR